MAGCPQPRRISTVSAGPSRARRSPHFFYSLPGTCTERGLATTGPRRRQGTAVGTKGRQKAASRLHGTPPGKKLRSSSCLPRFPPRLSSDFSLSLCRPCSSVFSYIWGGYLQASHIVRLHPEESSPAQHPRVVHSKPGAVACILPTPFTCLLPQGFDYSATACLLSPFAANRLGRPINAPSCRGIEAPSLE